jgi:signal transduction histidine kinase
MATLLLVITLVETLIVTLYTPVIQILLPFLGRWSQAGHTQQKPRHSHTNKRKAEIMLPFAQTRNHFWDVSIYGMDIIICGLVMYYSGPFLDPPFGIGSPFYRYGLSTIFAAAFAYRYRGGLLAAFGYDFFAILGFVIHAPGWHYYGINAVDIAGSLFDAPLVAILSAYIASLLESYSQSKKIIQENARTQNYLVRVGETLLKSTNDRQELLERSLVPIQSGGHFQRLSIAYISNPSDDEEDKSDEKPSIKAFIETTVPGEVLPDKSKELVEQVLQSGQKLLTFETHEDKNENADNEDTNDGIARLYLPLRKNGQIQIILGAESKRSTAFSEKQESFLMIAGAQLLVALDNVRLAEQSAQFVAATERGRIAREMHDGIAQLTYMLSLQAETCLAQAQRIAEVSEEDLELITPLTDRLGRLVKISKQALWETRNSMFSLKPSISGDTTLTQMLSNQIREFEAISNLPAHLVIEGNEEQINADQRHTRRHAQVGIAFFGIVQEALTNAYKHAGATLIEVHLLYKQDRIEVEVCDNGQGLQASEGDQRIYSGHGMGSMRERASELGGSVDILNRETGGVIVRACIPVEKKKENGSGKITSHDS